jgi:FkbM family methyltransferase
LASVELDFDRPYEPLTGELGLAGRLHWGLLRVANIPIRKLLHLRGYGLASRTLTRILGKRTLTVRVLGRTYLHLRLADKVWLSYVLNQTLYEREFFPLLEHLRPYHCGFVDGGANMGWWSILADKFFGWPCVAIEASRDLLPWIEANRRANAATFRILHRILWRSNGEKLQFQSDPIEHVAGHVALGGSGSEGNQEGETVSLDSVIFEQLETPEFRPDLIIVKLDVEGAESMALEGAAEALARRDMLLLYEDHGRDPACSASAAMLARGLRIYFFEQDGTLRPISDIASVRAVKPRAELGYNFLAVNHRRLAARVVLDFIEHHPQQTAYHA